MELLFAVVERGEEGVGDASAAELEVADRGDDCECDDARK